MMSKSGRTFFFLLNAMFVFNNTPQGKYLLVEVNVEPDIGDILPGVLPVTFNTSTPETNDAEGPERSGETPRIFGGDFEDDATALIPDNTIPSPSKKRSLKGSNGKDK